MSRKQWDKGGGRDARPAEQVQCRTEPAHEIMVLFVLRKLILEMQMRSHPVGLDV